MVMASSRKKNEIAQMPANATRVYTIRLRIMSEPPNNAATRSYWKIPMLPQFSAPMMTNPFLMFVDEIDCSDLFDSNQERERILIFEIC